MHESKILIRPVHCFSSFGFLNIVDIVLLLTLLFLVAGEEADIIIIDNLDTGTFFAKIIISLNGKEIELDSRPSDAMVIALKMNIPIMCVAKVIEKAGFQKSNLDIDKSPDENEAQTEDVDAYSPMGEKERERLSVFESFIDSLDIDE